ncbi:chromosome partitioning protein ParB [Desulfosarcina widdelii]|uniref:Chromosome partitioning protein ParB n=2 Tax=Desulfosarcina widdelii TaxID=947919 RepID=A0A5K7Z7V0_9BACT|nr:chromosome partitioning protein ParB [Desulfosarcina widdelii]
MAFEPEVIEVAIDDIQPMKTIKASIKKTAKYRQVTTSVREVGIIEHLVVYSLKQVPGKFLLLDGHLRLDVLKSLGKRSVRCLLATDDEGYTYNHKISRLAPIQEHFMILKAVEKGVSEERIAKALDVDVAKIRRKRNLLNGIDPEAVDMLKDKRITPTALRTLSRVVPDRQVEMCELMTAAHNYTVPFAKALLAATPPSQLKEPLKKKLKGLSPEEMARMEKETEGLVNDIKLIKESYGKDTLNLVLACGYLSRLLDNGKVVHFLSSHYPDILAEFRKIIAATSLAA